MKKKILLILLLFISVNVYAKENSNKVYDYASSISIKEEEALKKECNKYIKNNNTDVALILIKHTDFKTLEEYTKEFSDKYKVGMNNNFNGIIFVINVETNDRYIYVLGEEKYYTKTNIKGFLKETELLDDYYEIFSMFLSNSTDYSKMTVKDIIIVFFITIFIDTIVLLIIIKPKKVKNKVKDNKLKIINIEEKHISTKTKKEK